jgi:hypothetical protein
MREITVTLGGQPYQVRQPPNKRESAWRKQLRETIAPLLDVMMNFERIEFSTPADIAAFLQRFAPMLLDAPDLMLEMLYEYSSELAAQREAIDESAYSDEVLEAFKAVLGLAFPFARDLAAVMRAGQGLANGAATKTLQTTSTS